jgi:4-amino-4-deoxy-L-arabinose transferase-like glycosyltransferase
MTARAPNRLLLGLVLLMLLARLLTLGAYPLSDATEARYAEIARKMVELNDWVTPWYDYGVPFWAKPPLSTWITALSMELFGVNEFAARLPHFLAGVLVIALVADWLRRSDPRQALLASALLAGSLLFFVSAGAVMTDMSMAVGIVMAMRGFWLGLHGAPAERRREQWLFFCGLALGLLAKGPVVLVLCGVPIALWAIFTGNIRSIWAGFPWLAGSLLVAVLALPWYFLAEQHTPGFLNYFLIGEHWKRFTVSGWTGDRYGTAHAVPRGMIWLYAAAACLPWALLLPILAIGRRTSAAPATQAPQGSLQRYLWMWALAPCLFFTASRNIIWTYFLPGMPALAMLGAAWLARDAGQERVDKFVIGGLLFSLLAFGATLGVVQMQNGFKSAKLVVRAVENLHADPASLAFVGKGIYTPAFYSRGRAMQLRDPAQLGAVMNATGALPGKAPRFVALYGSQWQQLSAQAQQHLRPEGRFGNYDLYAVEP